MNGPQTTSRTAGGREEQQEWQTPRRRKACGLPKTHPCQGIGKARQRVSFIPLSSGVSQAEATNHRPQAHATNYSTSCLSNHLTTNDHINESHDRLPSPGRGRQGTRGIKARLSSAEAGHHPERPVPIKLSTTVWLAHWLWLATWTVCHFCFF